MKKNAWLRATFSRVTARTTPPGLDLKSPGQSRVRFCWPKPLDFRSFCPPYFDRLFDCAVDRFRDRLHMDFPMFFGSTRRSIFDRPVHLFFVRSTTHDFEKSVQNIAHAQKNRRLAMSVRWTCEDALDQKNARKPIEKRSTNRPKDIRKIIRKTIQKSLAKHRKNELNSMPKGFRERVAPQSDPEASRTRIRNVPEGPKSVPEASQGLRGASRERPGASQERPRAFPDRPGSLPKAPRIIKDRSKGLPDRFVHDFGSLLACSSVSLDPPGTIFSPLCWRAWLT